MNQPPGMPPGGGYPPPGGGYGPPPGGGYGGPPPGGGYGGPPPGGGYGGPPPGGGYPPPGGYGGPPSGGYGGPPPGGFAPMPSRPPPKSGMSTGAIVLIVLVVLVVLGGGSCVTCLCIGARAASKDKEKESSVSDAPIPTHRKVAPTSSPAKDNWTTAERPYVKFLAPPGWTTTITTDKDWAIIRSPKKDAVLTFTTFNRPGESTVRLAKAASVLGVTDIAWGTPRFTTVGKDRFDAHSADGSCNFEGPGGTVWYATVNTGSSDQILLIYTIASNAPRARHVELQAAIDSLQRR